MEDEIIIKVTDALVKLDMYGRSTPEQVKKLVEEVFIAGYKEGYEDGEDDACDFEYGRGQCNRKRF